MQGSDHAAPAERVSDRPSPAKCEDSPEQSDCGCRHCYVVAGIGVTVVIATVTVIVRGATGVPVAFLVLVALVVMVAVGIMGRDYGICCSGSESGCSYNGFYSNSSSLPWIAWEVCLFASASLVSKHNLSPSIYSEE